MLIVIHLQTLEFLYKLSRTDSSNVEQTFELFPGFDNMTDTDGDGFGDRIINSNNNSGRPDSNIPASAQDSFLSINLVLMNLSNLMDSKSRLL